VAGHDTAGTSQRQPEWGGFFLAGSISKLLLAGSVSFAPGRSTAKAKETVAQARHFRRRCRAPSLQPQRPRGELKEREHRPAAPGDSGLFGWLCRASEGGSVPSFVRTPAEAAFCACAGRYELPGPVVLELKRQYPEGSRSKVRVD
jgi:hypothetical protein